MNYMVFAYVGVALLIGLGAGIFSRRKKRIRPAMCMCDHGNHLHADKGTGSCQIAYGVSEKFPGGSCCACNVFVEKPTPKPVKDKSAKELEKMLGI